MIGVRSGFSCGRGSKAMPFQKRFNDVCKERYGIVVVLLKNILVSKLHQMSMNMPRHLHVPEVEWLAWRDLDSCLLPLKRRKD